MLNRLKLTFSERLETEDCMKVVIKVLSAKLLRILRKN
jgi:hypothetical protein